MARRAKTLAPLEFIEPMECKPVTTLPDAADWSYELKLDGYRAQALRDADNFRLLSRRGNDLTKKFPGVAAALAEALPIGTAVDGELVAFDGEGQPSFNALQNASSDTFITFNAFDLLTLAGSDIMRKPLAERQRLLEGVYKVSTLADRSLPFPGPVDRFVRSVRSIHGEGVVAKRLTSIYQPGQRSGAWVKMRLNRAQEFVIGGFTSGVEPFDAVLIGYYRTAPPQPAFQIVPRSRRQYVQPKPPPRELVFCASVRAGFVAASRRALYRKLQPLVTSFCPFANLPETSSGRFGQGLTAKKMLDCTWVLPRTVANFEFLEWTPADHLRHAHFTGTRDDKPASEVVRET